MSPSSARIIDNGINGYGHPLFKQIEPNSPKSGNAMAKRSLFKGINEVEGVHVARSSTFHHGFSQHSNFCAQALASRSQSYISSSSSSHCSSISGTDKATKVVDSERKRRKRRQNTESARRVRERKRAEIARIEYLYTINERRIKELEVIAENLSTELARKETSTNFRSMMYDFEENEDRPRWFGAPF